MKALDSLIVPLKNRTRYIRLLRNISTRMMVSREFPAVIGVDPTNICNLKCAFCGPIRMKERKGVMDMVLFERLLDECLNHRKLWMLILHNFGEPLMNKDIARMVSLAKAKDIARSVTFSTNGTLLTEDLARELVNSGLDGLVFSVDAYNREDYASLKGKDLLERVVENARCIMRLKKELKTKRPHVSAKMVRRKGYEHTFSPFVKMWSVLVDEAVLTPFSNWGNQVVYEGTEVVPTDRFACHFLWYYPVVSWDGRVFFCCAACDQESVIGDLNESSMEEIWKGAELKSVRLAHLHKRFGEIRSCSHCTYWAESGIDLDAFLYKKQGLSPDAN